MQWQHKNEKHSIDLTRVQYTTWHNWKAYDLARMQPTIISEKTLDFNWTKTPHTTKNYYKSVILSFIIED
jgi:hypothetical protein